MRADCVMETNLPELMIVAMVMAMYEIVLKGNYTFKRENMFRKTGIPLPKISNGVFVHAFQFP